MTELANWVRRGHAGQLQLAGRLRLQSLRSASRSAPGPRRTAVPCWPRRIELGHRHGRQFLGGQRRHRNIRVDPEPGQPDHARRHQADRRAHQPLRRHSDHRRSGHAGPDGAHRGRRRHRARRRWKGTRPIQHDPATRTCTPPPRNDYTRVPGRATGCKGARIGIPRAYFYDRRATPGVRGATGGLIRRAARRDGGGDRRAAGARARRSWIPPTSRRSSRAEPRRNFLEWGICGPATRKGRDQDCSVVFKYGMKRDFNAWLASLGAPRAREDAYRAARVEPRARARWARSSTGRCSWTTPTRWTCRPTGRDTRPTARKDMRLTGAEGIDAALSDNKLDALLFPGPLGAALAARPGYPSVIVPFGLMPVPHGRSAGRLRRRSRRPSASPSRRRRAASHASSPWPTPSSRRRSAGSHRVSTRVRDRNVTPP